MNVGEKKELATNLRRPKNKIWYGTVILGFIFQFKVKNKTFNELWDIVVKHS